MTRRVLIGWELGGGRGHLTRLKPIAEAMLASGHDVVAAIQPTAAVVPVFKDLKRRYPRLRVVAAPGVKRAGADRQPWRSDATLADVLARRGLDDPARIHGPAEAWWRLIKVVKPDLVISDFSPILNFVARNHAPLLVVGTGFSVPPPGVRLRPLCYWDPTTAAQDAGAEERIVGAFNRLAADNKLAPIAGAADLFQGDETFVCTIPEFDPYAEVRQEPLYRPYNVEAPAAPPSLGNRASRAFVYLPANHPHLRVALSAAAGAHERVSAFVPNIPRALRHEVAASNIEFHREAPSLSDALRDAALLVHQGGLGTAYAGLRAGTPQLALPFYLEPARRNWRCRSTWSSM